MSGGAGHMLHAITSLKLNRALLKKRKLKDIKDLMLENSGKTELEFKKVSSEEMAQIKTDIREQLRKNARREVLVYVLSTVCALGIFYGLYLWMTT